MKDYGEIYRVTCILTQKVYIGKTVQELRIRRASHYRKANAGSNTHFHNALRCYPIESFFWEVIETNIPKDLLSDREKYWIAYYTASDPAKGYNLTPGGDGGPIRQGFITPDEVKAKIGNANRGKQRSAEIKEKIRIRALQREEERKQRGESHPNAGRQHSDKQNREHSEWMKLHPTRKSGEWTPSEETRRKWREQRKGRTPWNKGKKLTKLEEHQGA